MVISLPDRCPGCSVFPQLEVGPGQPTAAGGQPEGAPADAVAPAAPREGGDLPLLSGDGQGGLSGFGFAGGQTNSGFSSCHSNIKLLDLLQEI